MPRISLATTGGAHSKGPFAARNEGPPRGTKFTLVEGVGLREEVAVEHAMEPPSLLPVGPIGIRAIAHPLFIEADPVDDWEAVA